MISQKEFRTSVNVEYDIGEENFFRKYLPTPSHADSIIGITKGFYNNNTNSAHIMIGPYGSGKSLLATVIANIVGRKMDEETVGELTSKFKKVHQNVYESLKTLQNLELKYIPITLSGSYHDFGDNLIEKIQQQLSNVGVDLELPTERNNIIKIIETWESEFPYTYETFVDYIRNEFSNIYNFKEAVLNGNRTEIEWFKKTYPKLTSGATFDASSNGNFQENLKHVLKILEDEKIGIFIIHDEFGRFLQELDQQKINKTMQEIQDIAEFVSRSNNYIQLLLISHQGMSQYMRGFTQEYQSEFQRIEKRYSSYFVESDAGTYYRIVENYLANNYEGENNKLDETIASKLREFNLFPELNHHEIENLIVKGCHPIHPITLYLLPKISRVFGQNERTLFTYLESDETSSLKKQLEKNSSYVYADTLFDYFFTNAKLQEIYDESIQSIVNTYLNIRANLDARKTNAHRIIKFITLWELTNSNTLYKLDENLLSFATGIENNRLKELMNELVDEKHIRFNLVQQRWELYEGSSVVIKDLIENKKYEMNITLQNRLDVLKKLLAKKYYLARDYNEEKNITRFMRVQLINSTAFISKNFDEAKVKSAQSDGTINYIILDNINDHAKVTAKINQFDNDSIIFAVLRKDMISIQEAIESYIVVEELKQDLTLLSEYKNLKNELIVFMEDFRYEIKTYLKSFIKFESSVDWFHKGRLILINSEIELENLISEIMWKLYPKTPIIMNDLVNRYHVIGIQKRSLKAVIDNVLNTFYEENIGIDGQGPAYLIYATIIKNNGINLKQLDEIKDPNFKNLRKYLVSYLENEPEGKLIDLYNILAKAPYGIRPPLIPLVTSILLRDKWNQFMFYRNKMFVPALEGEKIHEMFNEANDYEYVFHNYSDDMISFMNQLENRLSAHISEHVADETILIKVSSGLLNWLRNLPRQVQMTNRFLSDELLELKAIIRQSEVNPLKSSEELHEMFNGDFTELNIKLELLENAHNKFVVDVTNELCNAIGVDSFEQKNDFIEKWDQEKQIKSHLLSSLNQSSNIDEFLYQFIGTELKDWSDINYDLFRTQLTNDIEELSTDRKIDDNSFELYIDDSYKQIKKVELSKKSEVIFNNIDRIVKNAGRNVPREEINFILLKLMQEYME